MRASAVISFTVIDNDTCSHVAGNFITGIASKVTDSRSIKYTIQLAAAIIILTVVDRQAGLVVRQESRIGIAGAYYITNPRVGAYITAAPIRCRATNTKRTRLVLICGIAIPRITVTNEFG